MEQVATGCGRVEAPVWDAGQGRFFSDVLGGVYRLRRSPACGSIYRTRVDAPGLAVPAARVAM